MPSLPTSCSGAAWRMSPEAVAASPSRSASSAPSGRRAGCARRSRRRGTRRRERGSAAFPTATLRAQPFDALTVSSSTSLVTGDDLLGLLALGDVAGDRVHQARVVVGPRRPLQPAVGAVRAQVAVLKIEDELRRSSACLSTSASVASQIVGVHELDERPASSAPPARSRARAPGRVELDEVPVERGGADEIERELLLACEQRVGLRSAVSRDRTTEITAQHDDPGQADGDHGRPCTQNGRMAKHS